MQRNAKNSKATVPAMSQVQLYNNAQYMQARENETFLDLVRSGMTKSDLSRCIAMRPSLWQKYEHWLEKLPEFRPGKQVPSA